MSSSMSNDAPFSIPFGIPLSISIGKQVHFVTTSTETCLFLVTFPAYPPNLHQSNVSTTTLIGGTAPHNNLVSWLTGKLGPPKGSPASQISAQSPRRIDANEIHTSPQLCRIPRRRPPFHLSAPTCPPIRRARTSMFRKITHRTPIFPRKGVQKRRRYPPASTRRCLRC